MQRHLPQHHRRLIRRSRLFGAGIIFAAGVICFFLSDVIRKGLPFILAGLLAVIAADYLWEALKDKSYDEEDTDEIANAIIFVILAVVVLIRRDDTDNLIGAVWGILALLLAARHISHALHGLIHRDGREAGHIIHIVQALLSIGISIALLMDPAHHLSFHVYILGLELLDLAVRVAFDEI